MLILSKKINYFNKFVVYLPGMDKEFILNNSPKFKLSKTVISEGDSFLKNSPDGCVFNSANFLLSIISLKLLSVTYASRTCLLS